MSAILRIEYYMIYVQYNFQGSKNNIMDVTKVYILRMTICPSVKKKKIIAAIFHIHDFIFCVDDLYIWTFYYQCWFSIISIIM